MIPCYSFLSIRNEERMKQQIRILLLLLFVLPSAVMARGTQLKIIIFGDTNDPKIGLSVATDIKSYKKIAADIKDAVKNDGVSTTLEVFSGDNCSYRKLDAYLDNLSCKGDIVFFIYNGHGGRSHNDESKYPRMCLASHYESNWMKVSDLNNRLREKDPRLMIVVTDCCNSYYDRRSGNNESSYGISNNNIQGEGIRHLFLNYIGEVCMTASSPGEYGWGTSQGGILSLNFIDVIYKFDTMGNSANWLDFLQMISDNTYNTSLQYYNNQWISNTQRPVFDVGVSESDFNNDIDDGCDSINSNITDVADDNPNNDETVNDDFDDDDELYEDDSDFEDEHVNIGRVLVNSLWIVLAGFLFLWSPKFLKLTGISATIVRLLGIALIVLSVIVFLSKV